MMRHTAAEYEAMALAELDIAKRTSYVDDRALSLALAQVYATLCTAAPLDDDEDEDEADGF